MYTILVGSHAFKIVLLGLGCFILSLSLALFTNIPCEVNNFMKYVVAHPPGEIIAILGLVDSNGKQNVVTQSIVRYFGKFGIHIDSIPGLSNVSFIPVKF